MKNLTPIRQASRDKSKKFFNFGLQQSDKETRVACFSPEKRKLVEKICSDHTGCEIKKFKLSSSSDNILITDFASIKKVDISFPCQDIPKQYYTIAEINNECSLYDIVNTKGYLCNLTPQMKTEKDGKTLCYREVTLKDESDVIGVTLFGKAGDDINDKKSYSLQNVRISKYKCQRLLKTTDSSKLEQCNLDIESIDTSDLDSTK